MMNCLRNGPLRAALRRLTDSRARVATAFFAAAFAVSSPANADDFYFDFSFASTSVTLSSIVISATETATSGVWAIDSITGSVEGSSITGLANATALGSTIDQQFFFPAASGVGGGFFNDINTVTPSSVNGFAFSTANGAIFRVFNNSPTQDTFNVIGGGTYAGPTGNLLGVAQIQAVPLPAGGGLAAAFVLTIAGVAYARRRRRRG